MCTNIDLKPECLLVEANLITTEGLQHLEHIMLSTAYKRVDQRPQTSNRGDRSGKSQYTQYTKHVLDIRPTRCAKIWKQFRKPTRNFSMSMGALTGVT